MKNILRIQEILDENSLIRESKATVIHKTRRFDNIDSALSSVSFCTALLTLLMMTTESMQSKDLILRFTVTLLFLLNLRMVIIKACKSCIFGYNCPQLALRSTRVVTYFFQLEIRVSLLSTVNFVQFRLLW